MRPPQCRCALHPPAVVLCCTFFFFNDTATTEIYTLSLHDALPILERVAEPFLERFTSEMRARKVGDPLDPATHVGPQARVADRKSTRLNSSHGYISYAVFCLKKKKTQSTTLLARGTSTMLAADART